MLKFRSYALAILFISLTSPQVSSAVNCVDIFTSSQDVAGRALPLHLFEGLDGLKPAVSQAFSSALRGAKPNQLSGQQVIAREFVKYPTQANLGRLHDSLLIEALGPMRPFLSQLREKSEVETMVKLGSETLWHLIGEHYSKLDSQRLVDKGYWELSRLYPALKLKEAYERAADAAAAARIAQRQAEGDPVSPFRGHNPALELFLSPRDARIYRLIEIYGLPREKVAEQLDISVEAVNKAVERIHLELEPHRPQRG